MILIIGGAYQGKTDLACALAGIEKSKVVDGKTCGEKDMYSAVVLSGLEAYLKRFPEEGKNPDGLASRLIEENPKLIVCCREVGSGIIPMDKKERVWRESCGRCAAAIAARSKKVYRVISGIPCLLKGDPDCGEERR